MTTFKGDVISVLQPYLIGMSKDIWNNRQAIAHYVDLCMMAGFCKTEDDVRNCADRYIAGKRKVSPPGTRRRKKLAKEQRKLRESIPQELHDAVRKVIDENKKAVDQYLGGNEKSINALVGQVMRLHKFDALIVKELLVSSVRTFKRYGEFISNK